MEYKIKQSSKREAKTENYWHWSVWIDAREEDLDKINYVKYILHPTFPNRVRKRSSRDKNFKLSTKGWGEFDIFVQIFFKDQSEPLYMTHYLTLFPEEEQGTSEKKAFVSAQLGNQEDVANLKSALEQKNIKVESAETIELGADWSESIFNSIDEADIFVLYGHEQMSKNQEFELNQALEANKEIVIIDESDTFENPEIEVQKFKSTDDFIENY